MDAAAYKDYFANPKADYWYHMREGFLAAQRNADRPAHPVEAEGWDAVMTARAERA